MIGPTTPQAVVRGIPAAQLPHPAVMIEMSHHQWDIDIRGLSRESACRCNGFQHRQPSRMFIWIGEGSAYRYVRGRVEVRAAMASCR